MEQALDVLAHYTALGIDLIAILVIGISTIEALFAVFRILFGSTSEATKREVWLRYARWLAAGLTFQLAADIVHTAITPTWDEIGKVAAIAAVRTFLTFFLDRDIEKAGQQKAG